MSYKALTSLILSLFLLTLSCEANTSDCYQSGNYSNCVTCYDTFANALINTANNKYNLSRAYFSVHDSPTEVDVTYISTSTNDSRQYYWLLGGYLSLIVFIDTSLFSTYHHKTLTLLLPGECFVNSSDIDGFFEYTTQWLKGYATSQCAVLHIDSSYMGIAVRNGDGRVQYDTFMVLLYIFTFLVYVALCVGLFYYCIDPFGPFITMLEKSIKEHVPGEKYVIIPSFVLIGVGTIISLTAYFPNILIAFDTNPFYASTIAAFYGTIIIFFYTAYILFSFCYPAFYLWYLIFIPYFVLATFFISFISVHIITVPVNNSMEPGVSKGTILCNGFLILIGSLLAYKFISKVSYHTLGRDDD